MLEPLPLLDSEGVLLLVPADGLAAWPFTGPLAGDELSLTPVPLPEPAPVLPDRLPSQPATSTRLPIAASVQNNGA